MENRKWSYGDPLAGHWRVAPPPLVLPMPMVGCEEGNAVVFFETGGQQGGGQAVDALGEGGVAIAPLAIYDGSLVGVHIGVAAQKGHGG